MSKLRVIDGKYVIRGTIGAGGMGVVLEAEHTSIGRMVAVKVLHPHLGNDEIHLKRFMREARTAGMCGHPNVAIVYDAGTLEDGRPYIVMERLYGRSLAARILEGRPIAANDAIDITIQTLSALTVVHRAGVVHRDIKPDNLFLVDRHALNGGADIGPGPRVSGAPFVKVLDFGTSKPMSGPERDLTGTGIAIGTAFYMSPEQVRGERDLDGRVDIYACGVMLYEMLTGSRPFSASSEHGVLLKILSDNPTPVVRLRPEVASELEAIVEKAMARLREDRYQSAAEFMTALEAVRGAMDSSDDALARARPLPPPAPLPDSVRVPVAKRPPATNVSSSSAETRTGIYTPSGSTERGSDSDRPLSVTGSEIQALARAAREGAVALERAASKQMPVVMAPSRPLHHTAATPLPPSEPTVPQSSVGSSRRGFDSRLPAPTAPTRRVDSSPPPLPTKPGHDAPPSRGTRELEAKRQLGEDHGNGEPGDAGPQGL